MERVQVWGSGSFDNEAAVIWVESLEDADDLELVEETLERVLDVEERGEVPDPATSAQAIAAAETVAALRQAPASELPEEVRQWCIDNPGFDLAEAHPMAIHAIAVILQHSGLREWAETQGVLDDWEHEVEELRDRLRMG